MIRKYKANKVPVGLSNINIIRTTNINEKVWDYLNRYQNEKFVKKQLLKNFIQHTGLISIKAKQISATITQSRKYFESANKASLEIRPLILYYGIVGLSKCLILSGDNKYTLDYSDSINTQHRSHGLKFDVINPNEKKVRDGNSLIKEFCRISVYQKRQGLYNLFRQCYSKTLLPNNYKITVRNLLSYVPEFNKECYAQLKIVPKTWKCFSHFGIKKLGINDQSIVFDNYDYLIQKKTNNEKSLTTIKRCFPILKSHYSQQNTSDNEFNSINEAESIDDHIYVSKLLTRDQYALMREQNYSICDFDTHFILTYILSNLVRYKQDKWSNLILRKYNNDLFIINNFLRTVIVKFPLLILKELDNYEYDFIGPTATWG